MDIVAIVLGSLGFVLSLYIAIFEIIRQRHKLQFYIGGLEIQPIKDNASMVVFHLCFLNPSIEYKTVVHIARNEPIGLTVSELEKRFAESEGRTRCTLPNGDDKGQLLLTSELLQFPLDIPPLQSVKKTYPLYFEWEVSLKRLYQVVPISVLFVPLNLQKKRICKPYERKIPLQWLKDGGLHYLS